MSRASQFPIGASINLSDLENDVHVVLHKLRSTESVSWLPVINGWFVTRRDDAVRIVRDPVTYTVDHPGFSTAQVVGSSMLSLDGQTHQQHRQPFERPFRKREVMLRFEGVIAECANQLIDQFVANGHAELRRSYAGPIAVQTMIVALGLEETPVHEVLGWYDTIVEAVTRVTAGEPVSQEGREAFGRLRDSLLPSLKRDPKSSLLAAAGGLAGTLSEQQVVSNAAVLLFGGIETTEGMIANAFYHLLTNPKWLERARLQPEILPAIIEESLRMEPAAAVVDRYTTRDVSLRGVHIPANELVQVSLAGANRDPSVFTEPDTFNPLRDNLHSHVTFAQGPHVCLGIHLARLEAHHALAVALNRLPNLRPQSDAFANEARPRGLVFRKSPALHLRWGNS